MRALICDINTETQAFCAKRIDAFSMSDIETLDLQVETVSPTELSECLDGLDVLILGSGLGEEAITIARQALAHTPWLHIILFVADEAYGGGAFRMAHSVGVRKVFPDSASPLDLLQELVAIHSEFKKEGRAKEGKLIVVAHAKGGVGATSIVAALAEACSHYNRRTLLWDLDVETSDLCRALTVSGPESQYVTGWINGSYELNRQTFQDALIPISTDVSVLMPPDQFTECLDLVCHTDCINIANRVVELARPLFDVILVDTAGLVGPAIGALLKQADTILLVIDDTVLGMTAVDFYLNNLKTFIGTTEQIKFLINPYTGAQISVDQFAADLDPTGILGPEAWRLPIMPNDPKGATWAGSGYTLFSMGSKSTSQALEQIAAQLGLIALPVHFSPESNGLEEKTVNNGWFTKVFNKKKPIRTIE